MIPFWMILFGAGLFMQIAIAPVTMLESCALGLLSPFLSLLYFAKIAINEEGRLPKMIWLPLVVLSIQCMANTAVAIACYIKKEDIVNPLATVTAITLILAGASWIVYYLYTYTAKKVY